MKFFFDFLGFICCIIIGIKWLPVPFLGCCLAVRGLFWFIALLQKFLKRFLQGFRENFHWISGIFFIFSLKIYFILRIWVLGTFFAFWLKFYFILRIWTIIISYFLFLQWKKSWEKNWDFWDFCPKFGNFLWLFCFFSTHFQYYWFNCFFSTILSQIFQ